MEVVDMVSDEDVKKFIGEYKPERYLLDYKNPFTVGAIDLQDYYFEHRYQLIDAMNKTKPVVLEVAQDFKKNFGREYGFYEKYRMEDAETAIVVLGSAAGTAKVMVDELRQKGQKAGLIKIRVFRPFPHEELAKDLAGLKAIAVLDRADSNSGGYPPLYIEVTSALYTHLKGSGPKVASFVYGLGGRDIDLSHIKAVYEKLDKIKSGAESDKKIEYINLRG
jgi:pyruvate ferredoxin oxidoreductase alpha subunit